jgi:hypothetical protein
MRIVDICEAVLLASVRYFRVLLTLLMFVLMR